MAAHQGAGPRVVIKAIEIVRADISTLPMGLWSLISKLTEFQDRVPETQRQYARVEFEQVAGSTFVVITYYQRMTEEEEAEAERLARKGQKRLDKGGT